MILGDVVVDRDIRRLVFLLLADDRTFIDQVLIADERRGFRLLGRRRAFHLRPPARNRTWDMFSCLFVVFFGFTISLIPGNGLLDRRGDQPPVAHGSRDDDLLPVERHEIGVVGRHRAFAAFDPAFCNRISITPWYLSMAVLI